MTVEEMLEKYGLRSPDIEAFHKMLFDFIRENPERADRIIKKYKKEQEAKQNDT